MKNKCQDWLRSEPTSAREVAIELMKLEDPDSVLHILDLFDVAPERIRCILELVWELREESAKHGQD